MLWRWRLAARIAGSASVLALALCLTVIGPVLVAHRLSTDPGERAVVLAKGLSEALNVGAFASMAALVTAAVWLVARHRVRSMSRSVG